MLKGCEINQPTFQVNNPPITNGFVQILCNKADLKSEIIERHFTVLSASTLAHFLQRGLASYSSNCRILSVYKALLFDLSSMSDHVIKIVRYANKITRQNICLPRG